MTEAGTGDPHDLALVHTWRVSTASRVFVLALVLGQAIASGSVGRSWPTFLSLMVLAVTCAVAELPPRSPRAAVPAVEATAASILIVTTTGPVSDVSAYLVVPVLVAGVRLGARSVAAVAALSLGALAVVAWLGSLFADLTRDPAQVWVASPWLVAGAGAGLLAAWQTRTARRMAEERAPYAAAHRLAAQLRSLVDRRSLELDVASLSRALLQTVEERGALASSIWLRGRRDAPELLAAAGAIADDDRACASRCLATGRAVDHQGRIAVPMRVGGNVFATLVGHAPAWITGDVDQVERAVGELAVRLDTALLVERIHGSATSEERTRLARDLHDGVAQRLVVLGLGLDELAKGLDTKGCDAATSAECLRSQVDDIVQDLRFSMFDLRQDLEHTDGVSAALSEYTRELSRASDLRVHLSLDERGPRLPRRTEIELVTIAREAITNVHRHSGALNLWVSLVSDGRHVRLTVEDDGIGAAAPRPGHYGMSSMRERAARMDADLAISARSHGGTTLSVASRSCAPAHGRAFDPLHHPVPAEHSRR